MTPQVFDSLMRRYVARTPQMQATGMQVTDVQPQRGTMTAPARPEWVGEPARGWLHPGAVTVLADSACGLAVGTTLTERTPYATLDLRMDYLRPARVGHPLVCEAHAFRRTRSVVFVRAEVWQDDRQAPVAAAQASFMLGTPAGNRRPPGEAVAPAPAPAADEPPRWAPPAASQPVALDVPYIQGLGIREVADPDAPLYHLPFAPPLIGNPYLPALHGGVVAGFAESAALLHLWRTLKGTRLPMSIDFSVDYVRAARPEDCWASCEAVRVGARVALVQVRVWQRRTEQPVVVARGHFLLTAAEAEAAAPA